MAQQPPRDAVPSSPPLDAEPAARTEPPVAVPVPARARERTTDPASGQADWAAQIADTIDQYVGLVRDRTTRPALVAARALVFGVILAILGVAAIVLIWIAWITGITALVKKVWITYLITGGIFVLLGAFLMAKRRPPELEL